MELTLASMVAEDSEAVARLAGQLGYPSTAEQVAARFVAIDASSDEQAIVARVGKRVVGWIHYRQHLSLDCDARLEILGLVVEDLSRGKGIGSRLLNFAEAWGRVRGLGSCTFSSRITRPEAHRLYLRLGYEITKTSHYFGKKL